MKIVLTICSANYLAGAKVLGESLIRHNPDYHFVIGLVDRLPKGLEPSYWHPFEQIPVEELKIPDFHDLAQRYDIVELNTCVKPFFIDHLYRRDPKVRSVIYLDPDIQVYAGFAGLEAKLTENSLIVTPHGFSQDGSEDNLYFEKSMLATGIYNLGFIATARSPVTDDFLKWWQERLRLFCYYEPQRGLFVDQIWLNLAPIYFPGVLVERNPGCNMAYWNLFERSLSQEQGRYRVNGRHDLVFFHFSGFNPLQSEIISKRRAKLTLSERPDLRSLFEQYRDSLLAQNYLNIKDLDCYFAPKPKQTGAGRLPRVFKKSVKYVWGKLLFALPKRVRESLRGIAEFTVDKCRVRRV